jgi:hypothetical protein
MKKVYVAADWMEAQLVFDWLASNGLEPKMEGVYRQGAMGQLPVDATPSLWVADAFAERAEQEIGAFHRRTREREQQEDWVCAGCGEPSPASMDSCWNCGRERD